MTATPTDASAASVDASRPAILVLNSGSSSLKAGLFAHAPGVGFAGEEALITASASGLGQSGGKLTMTDASGSVLAEEDHSIASAEEALSAISAALKPHAPAPQAIGHRIVHGGPRLRAPVRVTADVLAQLRRSVHFAPLHLPGSLQLIEAASRLYPDTPQFACFDTAFHATMPAESTRLPIPEIFAAQGVQRYGFHGLSYESLIAQLRFSGEPLPERIVCAHLGGGSSLCAVLRGRSVDTTMGLTPTGGVPMATRTGDLDPGVLLFMARTQKLSLDALESVVNHDAGLKAICGESDMQTIEAMRTEGGDRQKQASAELGFSIYTTAVAQSIAALTVSLGGLDLLVFAGGIGEHSSTVRAAILSKLAIFGVWYDQEANARGAERIDAAKSKILIRIVPAEEDRIIAQHTRRLLAR
jgi:acetate kinase